MNHLSVIPAICLMSSRDPVWGGPSLAPVLTTCHPGHIGGKGHSLIIVGLFCGVWSYSEAVGTNMYEDVELNLRYAVVPRFSLKK